MGTISDLCTEDRRIIRPEQAVGLRYLGLEHIESGWGTILMKQVEEAAPQSASFAFGPEHVLYGKLRPYLNKVAVPNFEGCCSTELIPLRPKPGILREYLWYALRRPVLANAATAKNTGSRMPRADMSVVLGFSTPVPSEDEQRRLVDILSRAEGIVRLRREAQKKAAELIPALFLDMFGDPVTNPKGFETAPLGNLIKVRSGDFLSADQMDKNGDVPVYGGNGVNGYHSVPMFEERKVVIGRVGAYCGNVHWTEPCCWITDNALYVSEKYRPLLDNYLVHALKVARLNQYASCAAQPLISGSRIYPVPILVPPFELQRKFVERLTEVLSIQSQQFAATAKAEATFDALLARTFGGL